MEKQTFNFVIGDGRLVVSADGRVRLAVDHSRPITHKRCAAILLAARELAGRNIQRISIHHSVFSRTAGNECGDWAETCYLDKRYDYDGLSLIVWDRGQPVYANDNGAICRDQAALWDSL